ncbi:MAG: hypothetical protein A2033_15220 [Bacteroidetes bacterium GWA2_31_9]|nr:MAG: hypothetical protein A2033_15220 [Bacteroidetes bacterium GWA2_31_9]
MKIILSFLISIFISTEIYSQNDFWAEVNEGCVPLLVNFSTNADSSSTLYWTFGNGNQSNLFKPQVAYILPGIYDVKLIISTGNTTDTIFKKNYITVHPKPIVDFTTTTSRTGCIPLSVTFKDISPNNTSFQEHLWIFGDGQMSYEANPTNIYTSPENYNVTLKVKDQNGCENSKFVNEYVKTSDIGIVDFTTSDSILCSKPYNVSFTNLSTADTNVTYLWNFGNNTTSDLLNPSIVYSDSGNYTISLKATDNIGCSITKIKNEYIKIGAIRASFALSKEIFCKKSEINFVNTSLNSEKYAWTFGDGYTSILPNPIHSYSYSGDYIVTLMAENGTNCFSSFRDTIHIDSVVAKFSTDKHYICSTPTIINYTDMSYNANLWNWKLGNDKNSSLQNPKDTITSPSLNYVQYTDYLIVTSSNNCSDTSVSVNNIEVNLLKSYFTPNNSIGYNNLLKGCIPLNVQFQNATSYFSAIDSIVNFEWNINNTIIQSNLNPSYSFIDDGSFEASLAVESALGCKDTMKVSIITGFPQTPGFYLFGNDSTCANNPFFFVDTSTSYNYINSWSWQYSDGESDIINSPSHSFMDTGYVSASLVIGYNGCFSTIFNSNNIAFVNGPIGTFTPSFSCNDSYKYTFKGRIIDANRWYWDFGDGIIDSSFQDTISHTYTQSGDYLVKLNSYNDAKTCDYYWERLITVRKPIADFSCDTLIGCPGLKVTFNPDSSKDVTSYLVSSIYSKYQWLDTDLQLIDYSNDTISQIFNNRGDNNISLVVKCINGCYDTLTRNIKTYKPIASFSKSPSEGCLPLSVEFQNTTQSDTLFTSFWSFGDLINSNELSPTHIYNLKDTFSIYLKTADILGCSDSVSVYNGIRTYKPFPKISVSKTLACIGDSIIFSNINHEDSLTYLWSFGDGINSNLLSPIHVYSDTGSYNITLKTVYPNGCDSILTLNSYIHIQSYPEIEITTDTTFSDCYPLMVKFTSLSATHTNLNYNWNFGDNNPSNEQNPSHSFNLPGEYSISLEVSTSNGCKTSIIKENFIHVGGPYAKIVKPDIICRNQEYTFSIDNKINVNNFKWDMGDGTFKYGESVTHTYDIFGKFYLSLLLFSDSLMTCNKTIEDSIDIILTLAEFQMPQLGRCQYNTFEITDISVGAIQWDWDLNNQDLTSDQNPIVNLTDSGNYILTLITTNDLGCNDTISKTLIINPLPTIMTTNDTLICKGQTITLFADGGISNQWYLNKDSISNNLIITEKPDTSSIYYVTVTDEKGCINFDSISVLVQSIPFLYTSKDTTIIIGETVTISATSQSNASFVWEPDLWINCNTCNTTTVKPMESTQYVVNASDSSRCFNVTKEVSVFIRKEYTIDLPSVFTPNKDGKNDVIFPRGWGIKSVKDFIIFNKWGVMVFKTNETNVGWDGQFNGKPQEQDTYMYYVEVETYENRILSKKGSFNLIR